MSELGSLQEVKLAEVLRVLRTGRNSGLLVVQDGAHQTRVRLARGAIIHAEAGRLAGRDAVLDLFGWSSGQLTFVVDGLEVTPNVSEATDALLTEGERCGDAFHRMQEVLASDRLVLQWGSGPSREETRLSIGPQEWRVLRAVDGIRDLREVIETARVPRTEAMRVLFEFLEAGFIERAEIPKALRVQAQGLFGKDASEIDEHILAEWRKHPRFGHGVFRVEVRTAVGSQAELPVRFKGGLGREIALPRPALAELNAHDGDEVFVRPVA